MIWTLLWPSLGLRGCLSPIDAWAARLRTLRAIGWLLLAQALVATAPFRLWRGRLGGRGGEHADGPAARRLAAQIERAAWRLPFTVKCLPQAIALSWQLRRRQIAHGLVLAIRPPDKRGGRDDLHAWVECDGAIVLGQRPGLWVEVHRLGGG